MPEWIWRSVRGIAVCFAIAVVFTWLGVYDSDNMPMLHALMLWFGTMLVGGISSVVVIPWLLNGPIGKLHAAIGILTTALIISVPITAALLVFEGRFPTLERALTQYLYVLVISLVITTVGWTTNLFDYGTGIATNSATEDDGPSPLERFMSRLPVKYRKADLWALCSEDHYLRVYTNIGEELILMRLGDAVRELEGGPGLQVHRSWWIARDAVSDSSREKGKLRLHLPDGTLVPVSKSYQDDAKAAGLT